MLCERFISLSQSYRHNIALIHRDRAFSGNDLDAMNCDLADRLQSLGVGAGDRVGILLGNTPMFIVAMLAAMKLDASCVLLSTHFRETELSDALARTGPVILITTEETTPRLKHLQLQPVEIAGELARNTGPLKIWRSLTRKMRAWENELTIQFTSGVSGRSKIVPRTCANLVNELTNFANDVGLGSRDAVVCPAPFFHAYGLVNGFLLPFFAGATAILVDWFVPNDVVDAVRRHRATVFAGVPTMYKALSETYGAVAEDLSSLRVCFSAGAPLTQALVDKFRDRYRLNIHQQYGSTETGVIALNLQPKADVNPLSVGYALSGSEIRIVENGRPVGAGEQGEVVVRSSGSALQYVDDPELTAQKFRNGWYHTGDLGTISSDGELQLLGRLSSLINVAGLKVDPCEVEAALRGCDAVAECAVVGIPDPASGHDLVKAFVIARRETSRQELLAFCRPRLAAYKLPRQVEFVDALPKSATGKILVKYLLEAPERVATRTH